MANFIDDFMLTYGPEVSRQLSSNLNVDQKTVQKLIPELTPLILGGLKKQKDDRGGDARVNHILNKYGDSSVLGNIKDLITGKLGDSSADANLGGLLGDKGGVAAARALGKKMNIDPSVIMKIIPALAPVVLAALSKKRDTGKTGIGGIGSLLDTSGDGKIIDDIAGFILKGTGSKSADRGKNILGSLLSGMAKKK